MAIALDDSTTSAERLEVEWVTCAESAIYFVHNYCQIYDKVAERWIPFELWVEQAKVLKVFQGFSRIIVLKARQIGMTWLALGYALWKMLFHPEQTVLLFSRRDDEAVELLDFRLKGMYERLPSWMQCREVVQDNAHNWELSNGSRAKAFPTGTGDSYAGTIAIADEFDLVPDQGQMLGAVEPAVGDGGQMILLSRADKSQPNSRFKAIYRAAVAGLNGWKAVFLSWRAHPDRTQVWYEARKAATIQETGGLDDIYEQYPERDVDALAPRSLDKRIPAAWINQCYQPMEPLYIVGVSENIPDIIPPIDGLKIYRMPVEDCDYVIGADPAEGLASSDDSSATVLDAVTLEEVARYDAKSEPKHTFPRELDQIGRFYNHAQVLVERNNHGHAVIGTLEEVSKLEVLNGHDGRPGWNNTVIGKVILYDDGAAVFMNAGTTVHDFGAMVQIGNIEKNTLRAPEGDHDDMADSYFLALKAAEIRPKRKPVRAKMAGLPGRG